MVMSSQMVFTGEAGCPEFSANPFRADICRVCQNRIQSHSGATETQISRALEFSVATVPSLVWSVEGGGQLYLGGYKAAINTTFLTNNKVSLVVNTAQGLHLVLGPKYLRSLETRRTQCPDVEVHDILMDDDLQQKLCLEDLVVVYHKVMECLGRGDSVLVHCAQVTLTNSGTVQQNNFRGSQGPQLW